MSKRQRLTWKRITRVALVDKGDNPEADVLIHKRAEDDMADEPKGLFARIRDAVSATIAKMGDGGAMTFMEAEAARERREQMDTVWRAVWTLEESLASIVNDTELSDEERQSKISETLEQFHGAVKADVADVAKTQEGEPHMAEATATPQVDEEVQKRLDEIQKALDEARDRADAAEQEVAKVREDREREQFITKTQPIVDGLPGKSEVLAGILFKVSKVLDAEEYEALEAAMKGAAEFVKQSDHFKEVGADGVAGTAAQKLEAAADALQKADPKLSHADAVTEVMKRQPKLYEEYRREQDAAARNAR